MNLIFFLALAILEVTAFAFWSLLIALTPKINCLQPSVKALLGNRITADLKPSKAVSVDYSKLTIRQLRAMARGTGIKGWEKLRKAELVAALSEI